MIKRKPIKKKKAKKKVKPISAAKRHALWELAFGSHRAFKSGKTLYAELKSEKEKSKKAPKSAKASKAPKTAKAPRKKKAPKAPASPKAPKKKNVRNAA